MMNTILDRKSQSVIGRSSKSARFVELSEKRSLAFLGFFTLSGLIYVTAAVFTTMLTFGVSRDIWLAVTITTFAGMVAGITLFFVSYQSRASRIADGK
jgi:hypothetical protein